MYRCRQIFSFKTVPKADATYLEFRNTSVYTANLNVLFTLPCDNYCSSLPHKHSRSVVHSVNTELLQLCSAHFANGCTRSHLAEFPSTLIARHCIRLRALLQFVFSLVQLLTVFVLASRTAHKNQQCDVVCFINFAKCTVCSLMHLSSPNTEHTFTYGSHFRNKWLLTAGKRESFQIKL